MIGIASAGVFALLQTIGSKLFSVLTVNPYFLVAVGGFIILNNLVIFEVIRRRRYGGCKIFDPREKRCPLGISGYSSRQNMPVKDILKSVENSYEWLGFSGHNEIQSNENLEVIRKNGKGVFAYNILDPNCDFLINQHSQIEERPGKELLQQLNSSMHMIDVADGTGLSYLTHEIPPAFRLAFVDDNKLFLGYYPHRSCGYFSPVIEIDCLKDDSADAVGTTIKSGMYPMFRAYYNRERNNMLRRKLETRIIKRIVDVSSIDRDFLIEEVQSIYSELVDIFESVTKYKLETLVDDIINRFQ